MSDAADLTVRVLDDRDIVVAMDSTGYEVTYRKDGKMPMLVATDGLREKLTAAKVRFLAEGCAQESDDARLAGVLTRF